MAQPGRPMPESLGCKGPEAGGRVSVPERSQVAREPRPGPARIHDELARSHYVHPGQGLLLVAGAQDSVVWTGLTGYISGKASSTTCRQEPE